MARKQVDLCMICSENPCSCRVRSSSRTKRTKPKPLTEVDHAPAPSSKEHSGTSVRDLMKQSSTKAAPARPIKVKRNVPVKSADEIALESAIKALEPILHEEELHRYEHVLGRESLHERTREARRRRDGILARRNDQRSVRESASSNQGSE